MNGLGDANETTVFRFKRDAEALANEVSAIASTALSYTIKVKFVDPISVSRTICEGS